MLFNMSAPAQPPQRRRAAKVTDQTDHVVGLVSALIDAAVTDAEPQLREVVKARTIAGAVCITLPKELREALGIGANDRVMVQLDKAQRRLIVTKE